MAGCPAVGIWKDEGAQFGASWVDEYYGVQPKSPVAESQDGHYVRRLPLTEGS